MSSALSPWERAVFRLLTAVSNQRCGTCPPNPGGGEESLRRQVARGVNRQYVRQVLQVEVREEGGEWKVIPKLHEAAREKLEKEYS